LAYMVFPSADYSRFSHSLGACHVTQRTIAALRKTGARISDEDVRLYRLAGLLHDVGHYPFSHAMEDAIKDHFAKQLFAAPGGPPAGATTGGGSKYLDHVSVGKEVLKGNAELNRVLTDAGFKPEDIYRIFAREQPPAFANLISSDLDADRIDYL